MLLADVFAQSTNGRKLVIEAKRQFLASAILRNMGRNALDRNRISIHKIDNLEDAEKALQLVWRSRKSSEDYYKAVDFLRGKVSA